MKCAPESYPSLWREKIQSGFRSIIFSEKFLLVSGRPFIPLFIKCTTFVPQKILKMKNIILLLTSALLIVACGGGKENEGENKSKAIIKTNEDKVSYAIGVDAGTEIYNTIKSQGLDSVLSKELLLQGLEDAIMGKQTAIHRDSVKPIIRSYFMKAQQAQMEEELKKYEANKAEGEKFLAENKSKAGVTTTQTGLQYEVIKAGNGPKPMLNDSVTVHYKGTFLNGETFDSSIERKEPFTFAVSYSSVIEGWVEAVQLMPKGSKYKFYVPYELGYGDRFLPGIPPYSMLIFEIELIDIEKTGN